VWCSRIAHTLNINACGEWKIGDQMKALQIVVAALAAVCITAQARADTISFYLNQPECTGSCTTKPGLLPNASSVEVVVNLLSSTSATVEFISPSGNVDTPAYINVNDGGTVGHVTATYTEGTVANPTLFNGGSATRSDPGQAEDHFGNMNTWTGAVMDPTVTFTLTASGGFSWADVTDVLMPTIGYGAVYGHGFEAVTAAQDAGSYATPLPAALPLFAGGLGVFGLLLRGRKRKAAVAI
jgi:hypothetical protein